MKPRMLGVCAADGAPRDVADAGDPGAASIVGRLVVNVAALRLLRHGGIAAAGCWVGARRGRCARAAPPAAAAGGGCAPAAGGAMRGQVRRLLRRSSGGGGAIVTVAIRRN